MYLVPVIDWYSRKVLSWRLSNTPDNVFGGGAKIVDKYYEKEKAHPEIETKNNRTLGAACFRCIK